MAWFDTLSNEERAHIASKGWDQLAPEAAAQQIAKSYRNLEAMRPVPPPQSAAGYDFNAIRAPDGTMPKPEVLDRVRSTAFELKLSPDAANTLAIREVTSDHAATAKATADATARIAASETALKSAWGADYDKNLDVAGRAFARLGLAKEQTDALVTTLGVDKVMTMGHDLGLKLGEAPVHQGDTPVTDPSKPAQGAWTRETALVRRNEWTPEFMSKYLANDEASVKEFNEVTAALIGGSLANFQAAPDNFGRQGDGHGTEIKQGDSRWRG
jgi:hypothetical protein